MKRLVILFLLLATASAEAATPMMVDPSHTGLTLLAFFGVGVLLAFTPCVFPMIPILSGIIVGQKKPTTASTLKLSVVFVLSMALTYALAGVAAGFLGSTIQTALQKPAVIIAFSLIFVVMALSMFGLFELRMPGFLQNKVNRMSDKQKSGSLWGVAVMGVLSTLIASPCVTAPLVSVLTYIGESGNAALGGLILFVLALGMGLPLILFGLGEGVLLPKAGQWMNQVKALFGVMMLGVAIWMLSRLVSMHVTVLLSALLLIVSAIAFGALDFKTPQPKLKQAVSFVALLYGSILMVGAAQGGERLWLPLQMTRPSTVVASASTAVQTVKPVSELFQVVKTKADLLQALAAAKKSGKATVIDFWAGWCPDCRALDQGVLNQAAIQQAMSPYALIRVDITTDSPELKAIRKSYKVYGIPTLAFVDKKGQWLAKDNLSGEITALSLSQALKQHKA